MLFCRKRPGPKSNGAVFFLFIGLMFSLVLAGVVLNRSMVGGPDGNVGQDMTRLDASDALPVGAMNVVGPFELSDFTEKTLVYGYSLNDTSFLGLVRWDSETGEFILRSEMELSRTPNGFGLIDSIAEGPDWGISPILAVRGPALSDPRIGSVAFVVVHDANMAQVPFTDGDGMMPAEFAEGDADPMGWDVRVEDVTGDGVPEVLQRERYRLGEIESEETRAYTWDCGRLLLDERLSWALTVRAEIFPEAEGE